MGGNRYRFATLEKTGEGYRLACKAVCGTRRNAGSILPKDAAMSSETRDRMAFSAGAGLSAVQRHPYQEAEIEAEELGLRRFPH